MNIYTLPGKMVKMTDATKYNGTDSEKGLANKYIDLNEEYELDHTEVGKYHTKVYLKEYGRMLTFNSVSFENVTKQSKAEDKKHPQWKLFNK